MSEMKLKVSEKGSVSLYGLGQLPVTLYRGPMGKTSRRGRQHPKVSR